MRSRRAVLALLIVVALAGCRQIGPNSRVDGWSLGEAATCGVGHDDCAEMIEVATEVLAGRDRGHALILEATVYTEGLYPNDAGVLAPIWRSGGFPSVVLFLLADGSHRAIGVKYVLNDDRPIAFEHGPERREGGGGDEAPAPTT